MHKWQMTLKQLLDHESCFQRFLALKMTLLILFIFSYVRLVLECSARNFQRGQIWKKMWCLVHLFCTICEIFSLDQNH